MVSARNYRPDVDGLRAVAVLGVLLFHLDIKRFHGGFVGVDVFFVISGFLITRIIRDQVAEGTFTFSAFYMRRVRRIVPALVATLLGTLLAGAVLLSPQALGLTAQSALSAFFSVSNVYFWSVAGYFGPDTKLMPLLHTWSLSVEEQFYLVWPAAFVFLLARRSAKTVLIALGVTGLLSLAAAELALQRDPPAAFYLMPFRVVEFAIGAGLVWLVQHQPRERKVSEALCLLGLALILASVLAFSPTMRFPGLAALLPCAGAALVIHSGTAPLSGWLLRNEAMRRIGLISYSLYLVHWPVIVFWRYQKLDALKSLDRIAIAVISFALAAAMYRWIEQPFRYPAAGLGAHPWRLRRVVAALGLILVPSVAFSATGGWFWRLGQRADDLKGIPSAYQYHVTFYGGAGCTQPSCRVNADPAKPLRPVYVLGDSHAGAWMAGLRDVFPDHEFRFWFSSGCQFFSLSYDSPKTPEYRAQCDAAREGAFKEIARGDGPVVIAQMWSIGRGGMEDRASGKRVSFRTDDEYAAFIEHELRAIRDLSGGRTLIVLGHVPRFGTFGSPLDCVARPFFKPSRCASSAPSGAEALNRTMARHGGQTFRLVDPFDALCDEKRCVNFVDGQPAYSDDNHLSIYGSVYAVRKLEPTLREAFAGSSVAERPQ